ncbi:hypothetical protein [Histophilus somni]|uniref:hypothetical protein n=1 Tax=Histophilus somni TaxID=731 RepID=UPI00109CA871|nr:hypothetical protein [Histophilus somni]QEH22041.1 hypothetical protein FWK55_07625 [Histophilus somni]THA43501.1 hypothetical protein E5429_09220 [Histophilus somni]
MQHNLHDFKKKCRQWGYWATPRIGTEYPSISPSIPVPQDKYCGKVDPINEDLAMEFERCVLIMQKVTRELYDVFMVTYVYRLPLRNEYDKRRILIRKGICETLDISETTYKKYLYTAETSLKLMLSQNRCIFVA